MSRRTEMVSRFTDIGVVLRIHPLHIAEHSRSESITVEVGDEDESFCVMFTGKPLDLLRDGKIVVGDRVVVEGRIRKDKRFTADIPKQIVLKYASFVSVIS